MTLADPDTAINENADGWRFDIGVNVIPADTKNKTTNTQWSDYQLQPVPEWLHEQWKREGAFNKGIAIIPGRVWHKEDKQNLYFIFIDADKQKAIDELCTRNGKRITLQEMAQKFLVEQHADNPEKAHIYFYSPIPFPKKSADSKLGLEVKGLGEHGIAFCFPSIHKNGYPYEIIGTNQPVTLTVEQAKEMIQHIDQICLKHGVQYLEKGQDDFISTVIVGKLREIVNTLVIDTTIRIPQGQRHITLISLADSILFRHSDKKSEKQLKEFFDKINYLLCEPEPLPDSELNSIWDSAHGFVRNIKEEQQAQDNTRNRSKIDQTKDEKDKDKKEIYIQKFAIEGKIYEAVLIAQKSSFIVADKEMSNQINTVPNVDLEKQNRILKPYEQDSYLSRPYGFTNELEVEYYKNEAKKYSLDSLYLNLVKPLWKKYIDADNLHLSLCAFDTIATYFQDLLGLTHYLFFVGNNNSGKSNNLYLLHFLAYRNIMSTDMTSANIFRSLGSLDEGQVTICEDELDDLEDDRDKKRIYVNGYCTGVPVFRTEEGPSRSRRPTKYFTYCFKAFAAERLPDVMKAKGFNQRIIELQCTTGFPDYNIKEVNSPAGDETYQNLLKELEHARKILLMFRLMHYHDGLPNISTNLKGREKELFQPLIRLFQGSGSALAELKTVIDHFISNRRESNAQTAHAQIYRSIIRLLANEYLKSRRAIEEEQSQEETREPKLKLECKFSDLWDHFVSDLDGQPIANKKRSADFSELGEISQKEMSKILIEVFGSKRRKTTAGDRAIILNPEKIMRLGTVYDITSTVKVGEEVISPTSSIFSDYLTNLTNLVKERVGEKEKEMEETLENYS